MTNVRQHAIQTINAAIDDHETLETLYGEFVSTLLRQKWTSETIRVADRQPVWLLGELTSRGMWSLGRFESPISSLDHQVRQYKVRVRCGIVKNHAIRLAPGGSKFLLYPTTPTESLPNDKDSTPAATTE